MNTFKNILAILMALDFAAVCTAFAQPPQVTRVAESVVDPAALTINGVYGQSINGEAFQMDAVTSLAGYQYLCYYEKDRHLALGRRKLPDGVWNVIGFTDYLFKGDDAHNTVSMGICPKDGTIHLSFDHHGSTLHYRVSKKGVALNPDSVKWSVDLFGPVTDTLDEPLQNVTYPGFLQTPEGNLQFLYRRGTSGAGQRWMIDYDGDTGRWHDNRQIDTGDGDFKDQFNASHNRNAYPNGFSYDRRGRLYYTWVWRENTQGANHDLCFAYSDDRGKTWMNNAGEIVNPGDGTHVISIDSKGIVVVPLDRTRSLMNQQAQEVDSQGHIHVLVWHAIDSVINHSTAGPWVPQKSAYFHYWRDDQGHWQRNQIPGQIGNRPALFFDKADNAYAAYDINRDQTKWSHEIYFTDGQLTLATASADAKWTDWKIAATEPGSYMNETLGDRQRFATDGILSLMVQKTAASPGAPAALSVLDFKPSR